MTQIFELLLKVFLIKRKTFTTQKRTRSATIAFSQLTFLICTTMYLSVDVRQFRAKSAKLPEIASHPRSNTL